MSGLIIYYREIPFLELLALLALLGSFMVSYSSAKAEALKIDPPKGSMRRPERAVYLILGATLSAITIPLFENRSDFSTPMGYPMALALGLVAVVANLSAIGRFQFIARATRAREKNHAGAGTIGGGKNLIEEQEASDLHAAKIQL